MLRLSARKSMLRQTLLSLRLCASTSCPPPAMPHMPRTLQSFGEKKNTSASLFLPLLSLRRVREWKEGEWETGLTVHPQSGGK